MQIVTDHGRDAASWMRRHVIWCGEARLAARGGDRVACAWYYRRADHARVLAALSALRWLLGAPTPDTST